MKNEQKQLKIGSLMALMIFGAFAVCLFLVLLMGTDSYKRMMERDRYTYEKRTAVQYLTTRVRQSDIADSIAVMDFDGADALVLSETFEDETYETKLYCYDGWLMELYAEQGSDLLPMDGERILELKELKLSLEDSLLQAKLILPDGAERSLCIKLRGGREVLL